MATLREYFDADFSYAVRVHVDFPLKGGGDIQGAILFDFAGMKSFLACYVPDHSTPVDYFLQIIRSLEYGKTQVGFRGQVTLPDSRFFPGQLEVKNEKPLEIRARFFDDPDWTSIKELEASRRVFIYTETPLSEAEVTLLKDHGKALGHDVQFRSTRHATERAKHERPLAFISHDSRDKQEVARKIAVQLQKLMCPVWYDEFSLSVGDNLRESIEKGLKECQKCILILSPNFFANAGWTKKEFDSIFTREILEKSQLILPVWFSVTSRMVYEYSPALLNVKGLNWTDLGEDEVCRLLARAVFEPKI
ncbi:toll/interleukin-1 receptor domain-containing protein [Bradyrhizobium sp. C-145]|uniref:toll/interleukin-1 receptor domain-containing protein n=1 Tax=Bradyrhizobium sp. C-145 TaxID=574727 RepID=UPI00201B5E0C|nr:toll/interleukin-1 receptor domain-containing protein [Bradyrhizobium sp. C-145]UQR62715.1 toll/interleukin-1 receptor domain-containing protein [Bradyrhizobium sp. C-145]